MARDEGRPHARRPEAEEPTLEARLDARLKAMFQAMERERPTVGLPDLERLPRSRGPAAT